MRMRMNFSPDMRCGPTPEQIAKPGTEAAHQTALFAWAALHVFQWPELAWMFAVPNGGTRDKIEAGFLKAQGVRSGVPDIFLPVARRGMHGLFIEMKAKKGIVSPEQKIFGENMKKQGYVCEICYGWEEARDLILKYLKEGDLV